MGLAKLTRAVMDQGRIIEYDDPAVLLRNHKSKFYGVSVTVPFEIRALTDQSYVKLQARPSSRS